MMGLSDGRKSFPIGLAVLIQYRSVTASHPATQPASHVAVAITLNAKASSLKTLPFIVLYDSDSLHSVLTVSGTQTPELCCKNQ